MKESPDAMKTSILLLIAALVSSPVYADISILEVSFWVVAS